MTRLRLALSGILAAVAGIAAGHLVAGFVDPATSPVLTIGSTVIDLTPTPVKEWAVAHFGTADKPILLGSVVLVTLVAAGLIGLAAFWWLSGLALATDLRAERGADRPTRLRTARREFIGGAIGVATLSVLAATAGQVRAGAQAAKRLVLPRPAE